jgi:hypothetical protein
MSLLLTMCAIVSTVWATSVNIVPLSLGLMVILVSSSAYMVLLLARYRRVAGIQKRRVIASSLRGAQEVLEQYQSHFRAAEVERGKLLAPLRVLQSEYQDVPRKIENELRSVQTRLDQAKASFARKRQELTSEETQMLQTVQQEARRRLAPLQVQRTGIDQKEREETDEALRVLQEAHLESMLANATIEHASISGIGPKLKARLQAYGVHSARDIETWRIATVDGIGDAKASALMAWKNALIRHATVPTTLPQNHTFSIRNQFAVRRQTLDKHIRDIEETERQQRQSILQRFAQARARVDGEERQAMTMHNAAAQSTRAKEERERARLEDEYRSAKSRTAAARKVVKQKLEDLSRKRSQQQFEVCKLEMELDRYSGISRMRYLGGIFGIRTAA